VGMVGVFLLQDFQGLAGFSKDVVLPGNQLGAKICPLPLVHERLVVGGHVIGSNEIVHSTHPTYPFLGRLYIRTVLTAQADLASPSRNCQKQGSCHFCSARTSCPCGRGRRAHLSIASPAGMSKCRPRSTLRGGLT